MFRCSDEFITKLKDAGITTIPNLDKLMELAPSRIRRANGKDVNGRLCILKREDKSVEGGYVYSIFYQDADPVLRGDRVIEPLLRNDPNPADALAKVLIKGIETGMFLLKGEKLIENPNR